MAAGRLRRHRPLRRRAGGGAGGVPRRRRGPGRPHPGPPGRQRQAQRAGDDRAGLDQRAGVPGRGPGAAARPLRPVGQPAGQRHHRHRHPGRTGRAGRPPRPRRRDGGAAGRVRGRRPQGRLARTCPTPGLAPSTGHRAALGRPATCWAAPPWTPTGAIPASPAPASPPTPGTPTSWSPSTTAGSWPTSATPPSRSPTRWPASPIRPWPPEATRGPWTGNSASRSPSTSGSWPVGPPTARRPGRGRQGAGSARRARLADMEAVAARSARRARRSRPAGRAAPARPRPAPPAGRPARPKTVRARGRRARLEEIACRRVDRLEQAQDAYERFEHAEGWRRADVARLHDQLDDHWADVVVACVRADDPLAYGIDKLRHARAPPPNALDTARRLDTCRSGRRVAAGPPQLPGLISASATTPNSQPPTARKDSMKRPGDGGAATTTTPSPPPRFELDRRRRQARPGRRPPNATCGTIWPPSPPTSRNVSRPSTTPPSTQGVGISPRSARRRPRPHPPRTGRAPSPTSRPATRSSRLGRPPHSRRAGRVVPSRPTLSKPSLTATTVSARPGPGGAANRPGPPRDSRRRPRTRCQKRPVPARRMGRTHRTGGCCPRPAPSKPNKSTRW